MRTAEQVIVGALCYDHRPSANARQILAALEAAGFTVSRPVLPETERVFARSAPVVRVEAERASVTESGGGSGRVSKAVLPAPAEPHPRPYRCLNESAHKGALT